LRTPPAPRDRACAAQGEGSDASGKALSIFGAPHNVSRSVLPPPERRPSLQPAFWPTREATPGGASDYYLAAARFADDAW
jgi:hypothetical protein